MFRHVIYIDTTHTHTNTDTDTQTHTHTHTHTHIHITTIKRDHKFERDQSWWVHE